MITVVVTVNQAELSVLRGMEATLEEGVEIACVASADSSEITALLQEHGYDIHVSNEFFETIVYASPGS